MSRARDLARLGNENIISVDSNNNVGINSTVPEAQLDVVGVISATTFTGNVTGTVTGDATGLTGTPDIVVNNITGVAATFTGELTYEDVTSIDSIGVVTARSGVVVSSGSSIGIGTDDPNKDFHVESTIPSIVLEESDAAADNKVWTWKADSEELVWQAETDTYTPGSNLFKMTRANQQINTFEGHNSGNAWFVVDNANREVGIGTDNPLATLHVKNDSGTPGANLQTWTADTGTNTRSVTLIAPETDSVSDPFTFYTNNSWNFRVDSTDALTIDTSGDVGIGTNNPAYMLDVTEDGTDTIVGRFNSTGRTSAFMTVQASGTTLGAVRFGATGDEMSLWTGSSETMRLDSSGNVGIGTDNPAEKLSVAGNVRVQNSADASQYLNISYQGIDFQNTGAGSSTAATSHLLDDYEEGTFTPTITDATAYSTQQGYYTKVGRLVTFAIRVQPNAGTGSASALEIGGLPFTSANIGSGPYGGAFRSYGVLVDEGTITNLNYHIPVNSTVIRPLSDGSTIATNNAAVNFIGNFLFNGFYYTA